MKRVFISGASGFLGNHLLNQAPESFEVLAQYQSCKPVIRQANHHHIQLDLCNSDFSEIREFRPRVIIHCAAASNIDFCEQKPAEAALLNFQATMELAQLSERIGARMLFTSTDQIYDGSRELYKESDLPEPLHHYGRLKVRAEEAILENCQNALSLRCALIVGKSLHGNPTFNEKMLASIRSGRQVNLFVDEYRTPVEAENLSRIIWELAESDYCGTLNVAGPDRMTRYQMGELFCSSLGLGKEALNGVRMSELHLAVPRPVDCSMNNSVARSILKQRILPLDEVIVSRFA